MSPCIARISLVHAKHLPHPSSGSVVFGAVSACSDFLGSSRSKSLLTGPMVGHVSMRSAQLWIQTVGPSEVVARYMTMGRARPAWATSPCKPMRGQGTPPTSPWPIWSQDGVPRQVQVEWQGHRRCPGSFDPGAVGLPHGPPAFSFVTGSCAFINEPSTTVREHLWWGL